MRFEDYKPGSEKEKEIRRKVHARAILQGITMRQAVFAALELWLKQGGKE
jgi:hypothetical protein